MSEKLKVMVDVEVSEADETVLDHHCDKHDLKMIPG